MKYYEVVLIGHDETRHYICNNCETDRKIFAAEESEIKMIRHIQTIHADKKLVVETSGTTIRLVPDKDLKEEGKKLKERPAKKFKLFQATVSNEDGIISQAEIEMDHIFFPCEECTNIYLTKVGKMKHLLTHD